MQLNDSMPEASRQAKASDKTSENGQLQADAKNQHSVLGILQGSPQLSEAEWKTFVQRQLADAPPKRLALVQELLFRCGRKCCCWPSDVGLGQKTGYDERSIRRHMHELDAAGITERIALPIKARRAIFFLDHPACGETMTRVKESGQNVRATRTKCPPQAGQNVRVHPDENVRRKY